MKTLKNFLITLLTMTTIIGSFQSCTNVDRCEDIVCQNDATCDKGICDCPPGFTGDLCETALTIQERLENETPYQIYQSDNSLLDDLYGNFYEGGLIFYLNTSTGNGLVCTPNDLGEYIWCDGDWDTAVPTVLSDPVSPETAIGARIGDGLSNTNEIVSAGCNGDFAAMACAEYNDGTFSDWYLPSREALGLMWRNLADSDGDNNNTGIEDSNNLGNFEATTYVSSTEEDITGVWRLGFNFGFYDAGAKSSLNKVRAIRSF